MTKEQKDKILKAMAEERNYYARGCNERIAKESGKIEGADYMLQRFLDVLRTEVDKNDVVALDFSDDIDTPNKYQTADGKWHEGRIPTTQNDCEHSIIEADKAESEGK